MFLPLFTCGFHGQNAIWHLYRSLLFPKLHRSLISYLIYWWFINVIKWAHYCFPCFPVFTVMVDSPVQFGWGSFLDRNLLEEKSRALNGFWNVSPGCLKKHLLVHRRHSINEEMNDYWEVWLPLPCYGQMALTPGPIPGDPVSVVSILILRPLQPLKAASKSQTTPQEFTLCFITLFTGLVFKFEWFWSLHLRWALCWLVKQGSALSFGIQMLGGPGSKKTAADGRDFQDRMPHRTGNRCTAVHRARLLRVFQS